MNWPTGFSRTPEHNREKTYKFSVRTRQTKRDLRAEMERMEVDDWRLEEETGRHADPGVVIRWRKDGVDHAVACDQYERKCNNLREIYLWIQETRKRSDRPVETGSDNFAAAALPAGEGQQAIAVSPTRRPHEVLGVSPDAPPEVVKGAARSLKAKYHPDKPGGDRDRFVEVQKSEKELLKGNQ